MAGKAVSSLAQQEEKERRGRVETFLGLSSSNRQLPIGDNHSGSLESAHQEVSFIQSWGWWCMQMSWIMAMLTHIELIFPLADFEIFDQSDEETWPDQKKTQWQRQMQRQIHISILTIIFQAETKCEQVGWRATQTCSLSGSNLFRWVRSPLKIGWGDNRCSYDPN